MSESENRFTFSFGLPFVVPNNAIAAWGGRLIVDQSGYNDLPWDRQDAAGDEDAILEAINSRQLLPELMAIISDLLRDEIMLTLVDEDFILYMDDTLTVHANTRRSAGYCYLTAWLTPAPESPTGENQ